MYIWVDLDLSKEIKEHGFRQEIGSPTTSGNLNQQLTLSVSVQSPKLTHFLSHHNNIKIPALFLISHHKNYDIFFLIP